MNTFTANENPTSDTPFRIRKRGSGNTVNLKGRNFKPFFVPPFGCGLEHTADQGLAFYIKLNQVNLT